MRIFTIFLVILAVGCGKKKTNTELFEESFDKNVKACASVLIGVGKDSVEATNKCACMLHSAFKLDSTFVLMDEIQRNEFLKINAAKIEELCNE